MVLPFQPPEFFSVKENYAVYQPVAELTKDEATESVDRAVLYCRENGIAGLIADITHVTGLPMPSVSDVFWFITKWAETAKGKVAIAMVAPAEMITPDRIGITVARNRGLLTEIFTDEKAAHTWLSTVCKTVGRSSVEIDSYGL